MSTRMILGSFPSSLFSFGSYISKCDAAVVPSEAQNAETLLQKGHIAGFIRDAQCEAAGRVFPNQILRSGSAS